MKRKMLSLQKKLWRKGQQTREIKVIGEEKLKVLFVTCEQGQIMNGFKRIKSDI